MKKDLIYEVQDEGGDSCRRPQPASPYKDQQLESQPGTKTALEKLWSSLKKLHQHSRTQKPENNQTRREGRQLHFPASSHPPSQHCSVPSGNSSARKSFPHKERKSGMRNQLPHPFGAQQKNPTSVSPYPDQQS